jgi:hypothetical protein
MLAGQNHLSWMGGRQASSRRRIELVEELQRAHAEAAHLSEMMAVLQASNTLDATQLRLLMGDWLAVSKQATDLHDELRA